MKMVDLINASVVRHFLMLRSLVENEVCAKDSYTHRSDCSELFDVIAGPGAPHAVCKTHARISTGTPEVLS